MTTIGELEVSGQVRSYKYKIEQTAKGARVTVHSDTIDEAVADYRNLRSKIESEGFKLAQEE